MAALLFATPALSETVDGIWRSEGYGYVFKIQGAGLKAFEMTSSTCVASFTARLQKTAAGGRETVFKSNEGDLLFFKAGDGDHRALRFEGTVSDLRIDRQPRLPAVCEHLTPNTPGGNFEVFTRTFSEQYISFGLKHVDWERIVNEYRPKLTAETTPTQLFDLFEAMIKPFGDAHTAISAPSLKREFEGFRSGGYQLFESKAEDRFVKKEMPRLWAVTERAHISTPLRKFANGQLQYGHINGTTGYIRVLAEGGYTKHGGYAAGVTVLESALDDIFSDPNLKALVLDLRINFGGSDTCGLAIASRLAISKYLAFTKQARADPVEPDKWTPGQPSLVQPGSRPGFHGPVVELTGPLTMSAGESLTQALMGRTPRVIRIGENTQGVFSDVLSRRLPNKWTFGLPNEVFRTPEGTAFDGSGIPPDIYVPVFADADVSAGRDPAMAKAREILSKPF